MKKVILLFLVPLMFIGCKKVTYDGKTYGSDSFINLEKLTFSIYKDTYTGVLYRYGHYEKIPIMEADGTPLTFEEWEKRIDSSRSK